MRPPAIPPQITSWTLSDGYELQGRLWPTSSQHHTAILYLHGIQSHGGWYAWSAAQFAQHGLPVILPDRRGSGMNTVQRGDVNSFQRWLADLDELADWAQETWGAKRIAVVAVSWGGKLAMAWAAHRHKIRGENTPLLLLAPGLLPQVDVSAWTKLRIGLALLFRPQARFEIPLSEPALFTDHDAGQKFIRTDQQKLTNATARFLYQSSRLDHYWKRTWRQRLSTGKSRFSDPFMVCLADRDRIVNNARTVWWLHQNAPGRPQNNTWPRQNAGSGCEIRSWAAAHSLEFEPDPSPLSAAISAYAERLNA